MANNIINHLIKNPKSVFLLDGIGAALSIFFLFVILRNHSEYFGMPKGVYNYLSAIAACICIYSAFCYLYIKQYFTVFILALSLFNLLYSIFTIIFLIIHSSQITNLGITYFIIELALIVSFIYIEMKVSTTIKKCNRPQ